MALLGRDWSPVTPRHFAWQTWHLVVTLHVAGVALGDIYLRCPWQAWHLGCLVGSDWSRVTPRHFVWQAWHLVTSTFVSRGRRGSWRHPPSFCVASGVLRAPCWLWWRALIAGDPATLCLADVALGDISGCDIHLRFTWQAWHFAGDRRGICDIHLRFTWQAWHLATSTFVLRGRRGT